MAGRVIEFDDIRDHEREGVVFCDITASIRDTGIWRQFCIPSHWSLLGLASALLDLFDWSGSHVLFFAAPDGKTWYVPQEDLEGGGMSAPRGVAVKLADGVAIADVLAKEGDKLGFAYDLGDDWRIDLELRGLVPEMAYPFNIVPICTEGEMASPLEDVGGVGGWERFCEVMGDPDHPDFDELREWAGFEEDFEFDEEAFVPRDANVDFALNMMEEAVQHLPDDVELLKDALLVTMAENLAWEDNQTLLMGDMLGAMQELSSMAGLEDFNPLDLLRD